jgi:hypothetical protein
MSCHSLIITLGIALSVAVFTVTSLIILDIYTILLAIIALIATFVVFVTLHHLSRDGIHISFSIPAEQIFEYLSWRVALSSSSAASFQIMVFGPINVEIAPILQNAILKAAFWFSLFRIVSLHFENSN